MEAVRYRCGDIDIDSENRCFSRGDEKIVLEHKVFAVILQLLARPGSLVTRDELLDTVWGHRFVTPSTLNRVIALARRAFGDDAQGPRHIETVHGAGYRYIGPVESIAESATAIRSRFGPPPVARLPFRVQRLIGRETELAQIHDFLQTHRAVTIVGTGGMGKTKCALEFARQNASSFPDGVWFYDLAPFNDADDWLQSVAATLSVQAAGESELLSRVSTLLSDRCALLVLDNCDRIAPAVGVLAYALLTATERLKIISTSQRPLGFVGEHLLRMPPLALPEPLEGTATGSDLERTASVPALALLLERIHEVQSGIALTPSNLAPLVDICRRLEGMPLAIELAAARFAVLSADEVLDRLEKGFRFLSSDATGREQRHRNLLHLLDWSVGILSTAEAQLLRWLSVFTKGWSVEATVDVASVLGHDTPAAVDVLEGLVENSLVTVDTQFTPPRYHLLESVREFALQKLASSGEEPAARKAHLAYIRRLAETTHREILAGRIRARFPQLIFDEANISSAVEFACATSRERPSALAIVGSLMLYWRSRGNYKFAQRLYELALRGAAGHGSPEHSRALLGEAVIRWYTLKSKGSVTGDLRRAADAAHGLEDYWGQAWAEAYLALGFATDGEVELASDAAQVAFDLAQEIGDDLLTGLAYMARGWVSLSQNDNAAALAALQTARGLGQDFHQHHFIEVYIGLVLFRLNRLEASAEQLLNSLHNAMEYQNLRGMGGSLEGSSYLAARSGRLVEAALLMGSAERIREQTEVTLIRFWREHHEETRAKLLNGLGQENFEAQTRAGRSLRDEDAASLAAAVLERIATDITGS